MTPAIISQTARATAFRRIRGLSMRIAVAHRMALDDILADATREIGYVNGHVTMGTQSIKRQLATLQNRLTTIMRSTFAELVRIGHAAGQKQIAVGMMHAREAIGFPAVPDGDNPWGDPMIALPPADETPVIPDDEPLPFDSMVLRPLSQAELYAILMSRNAQGLTWEEQLDRSSHRVADPQRMAYELSQGFSEGENLTQIRNRIKPLVENLNVSAARIARTEGFRMLNTAQQREIDRTDVALRKVGRGVTAMVLHCAMMPTSAQDHIARNGKVYHRIAPEQYVADDGEVYPQPPYGHPNCSCYGSCTTGPI